MGRIVDNNRDGLAAQIVQTHDAEFGIDRLRLNLRMAIAIHGHRFCAPADLRVLNIRSSRVD